MFTLKVNESPGHDKLVDLSSCVDETISEYSFSDLIGRCGIEKELRKEINIFMDHETFEKEMQDDLVDTDDAVIYIDDSEQECGLVISFKDEYIAKLFGLKVDGPVRGTVKMACDFFFNQFTENEDSGRVSVSKIFDGICACLVYKILGIKAYHRQILALQEHLYEMRKNGVDIMDCKSPYAVLMAISKGIV